MTDGVDWLRVPDGHRPERVIPVEPPGSVGGFRFARVDDGVQDDGAPYFAPERGVVSDPAERERLLAYLDGGAVVLETDWYDADHIDPTRQFAVQKAYRTDGVWVWNAAVPYYLRHHQIAPEPEFRRWMAEHDYHPQPVAADVVARALDATNERLDILFRLVDEYEAAHPTEPTTTDLSPEVRELLTELGWQPGRDVSARVDAWLAGWVDELAGLPFERDGYPRYEPIPAALAVLNEFGGLRSLANGPGITAAQTPFTIYPTHRNDDLMQFVVEVQMLGERVGERAFQVGDVERGMAALIVDERGRVFASGPTDLYLGKDIHEALTRLLRGIRAQRLNEVEL
ncbi:MAG TPA: SUKH-3 domain-containing protein [Micromonosporaceae bacterium]|jgi:hypothetical protein